MIFQRQKNNMQGWDTNMQRTEVEQDFLDDVGSIGGFFRRTDGKIERAVYQEKSNIVTIRGKYYRPR